MLQTKALYNLLRLNAAEDPAVAADPWALEDLRSLPMEELFVRLEQHNVQMDQSTFHQFASNCETPEELADLLSPDTHSDNENDPFYLLVFELWRRLLPEKQSLSIFCDELDYRIGLYDQGKEEGAELVQDGLSNLLEVLDENADAGADPEDVFTAITDYCAHDLESFLYDYISELLDSGNSLYASELIEGFSPYVTDPLWFDFLKTRLLACTDVGDANLAMHRLLESELDLSLILEMLCLLAKKGEPELFSLALKKAIPLLTTNEELMEVAIFVGDYFSAHDEEEKAYAVQKLIKGKNPTAPILPADLKALENLIAH